MWHHWERRLTFSDIDRHPNLSWQGLWLLFSLVCRLYPFEIVAFRGMSQYWAPVLPECNVSVVDLIGSDNAEKEPSHPDRVRHWHWVLCSADICTFPSYVLTCKGLSASALWFRDGPFILGISRSRPPSREEFQAVLRRWTLWRTSLSRPTSIQCGTTANALNAQRKE